MDSKTALKIARAAFPQWKGRKVTVSTHGSAHIGGTFWDEGSRREYRAVNLATGGVALAAESLETPAWYGGNGGRDITVRIPNGAAIVSHFICCGKDAGCTVYLAAPDSLPASETMRELSA